MIGHTRLSIEPSKDHLPLGQEYISQVHEKSWASTAAVRRSMQSNRSRDTRPEVELRRALHAMGLRYRVCVRPLPSVRKNIDIVFRPARVAVEVYGCFWHGCPEHHRQPRTNADYWTEKIARNIRRDQEAVRLFGESGWMLLVVWEHEPASQAAARVATVVRSRRAGNTRGDRTLAPDGCP